MTHPALPQVAPRFAPVLDPLFRPAALSNRAFRDEVRASSGPVPVRLALEQADGSVFTFATEVLPSGHPRAAANAAYLERYLKLLLWSRGGFRVHFDGPADLAAHLAAHYRDTSTGQFDSEIIGRRIYDHPLEIVPTRTLPAPRSSTTRLGRHLDGCRIGFDLGGSDRKVAAVIDGRVVFSEETVWDPYPAADPRYHFDGIMDSLKKAAAHLPRVDAIGGSAAGVYVNNRVKTASLFRAVPPDAFARHVRDMFLDIRKAWNNVPLEVVNDGEVTALAGAMSLGENAVLGLALGTSTAGGYVNAEATSRPGSTSWPSSRSTTGETRRRTSGRATPAAAPSTSRSRRWGASWNRPASSFPPTCPCRRSSSGCRRSWPKATRARGTSIRRSASISATGRRISRSSTTSAMCWCWAA
jgi:hypothetical protein